jgi:hypothetical protein
MRLSVCVRLLIIALLLAGCQPLLSYLTANQAAPDCAQNRIAFTQATGCQNDGSFEFCMPADDPAALEQVMALVPDANCISTPGRARCDMATQLLCMVPTDDMCHPDQPDALTTTAWQTTCQLADLPFVERIVPTWYE